MGNPIQKEHGFAAHLLKDRAFPENTGSSTSDCPQNKAHHAKSHLFKSAGFIKQQSLVGCIGLLNAETDNHIPDITLFPGHTGHVCPYGYIRQASRQ